MSCPICLEKLKKTNISITICNHIFCTSCLLSSIQENNNCPLCRKQLVEPKKSDFLVDNIRAQSILIEDLVDILN